MTQGSQSAGIIDQPIRQRLQTSFIQYAMSVIRDRALPDVRDGLKPVHRRIIWAMQDAGFTYNRTFRKSARIIGEILGKYHPHGDKAIYDAMVRMAQDFSLAMPLVEGQGNFGTVDGDPPAAMRYCVTGDTLIPTDLGIVPIETIGNGSESEHKIDRNILSANGTVNKASKFFDSGEQITYEITTDMGYQIKGSFNHPVLCWIGKDGQPQLEWKMLCQLHENDIVVLQRNNGIYASADLNLTQFWPELGPRHKPVQFPEKMNEELAFLLGALVAEGSFHQKMVLFGNSDLEYYNKIKSIIHSQFKNVNIYERIVDDTYQDFSITQYSIGKFLTNIGLLNVKSDKKVIPFSVLQSSKDCICAFLSGLFEGDGSVNHTIDKRHGGQNIQIFYNSKSIKLLHQLKVVLLNLGIRTSKLMRDKRIACYRFTISGYDAIKNFEQEIDFFSERKRDILANIENISPKRMSKADFIPHISSYFRNKYRKEFLVKNNFDRYNKLMDNKERIFEIIDETDRNLVDMLLERNYLFNKVEQISECSSEKVYSLRVDTNCHSFIGNGFINHNTEARMAKLASELVKSIEEDTVDFIPNFDSTEKEPLVLPVSFPNLLVNGSMGIAVGMSTNIPPFNFNEVLNCTIAMIDRIDETVLVHYNSIIELMESEDIITPLEIMEYMKGPDFPTGGEIHGTRGILDTIATGRGKFFIKSKVEIIEPSKESRTPKLIITEIPYQVNKADLVKHMRNYKQKEPRITSVEDYSSLEGLMIEVKLKSSAQPAAILNQLMKHTPLRTSYSVINRSLIGNNARVLSVGETLGHFIDHRIEIIERRTKFRLIKAENRLHIVDGLLIALEPGNLDKIIAIIRNTRTQEEIKKKLAEEFLFSDKQIEAILSMQLRRLSKLEKQKLIDEQIELKKNIDYFKEILSRKILILRLIKDELLELKSTYGINRRTRIIPESSKEFDDFGIRTARDYVPEEKVVYLLTGDGMIKSMPLKTYRAQRRGGKGIYALDIRDEDRIKELTVSSNHDDLLVFTKTTTKTKVYSIKVFEIPEMGRYSKGVSIQNLIHMSPEEEVYTWIPVSSFKDKNLLLATKRGIIKKTRLELLQNIRKNGIIAINLKDGDDLVGVAITDSTNEIVLGTRHGKAIRFKESDVRATSRNSMGVIGIKRNEEDYIVGMTVVDMKSTLLVITENGYGKRSKFSAYRLQKRAGKGLINVKITEKNGPVVGIVPVTDDDEMVFIATDGKLIRAPVVNIRVVGRASIGVRIMKLSEDQKLVAFSKIRSIDIEKGSEDNNADKTADTEVETPLEVADEMQHEVEDDSAQLDKEETED